MILMILSSIWAGTALSEFDVSNLQPVNGTNPRETTAESASVHADGVTDGSDFYPIASDTPQATPAGNAQVTLLDPSVQAPSRSSGFRTAILAARGLGHLGVGGTTFVCTYMLMACAAAKLATPLGIGGVMLAAYHTGPESMLVPSVATTACTTVRWMTGFAWASVRSGVSELMQAYRMQYPL